MVDPLSLSRWSHWIIFIVIALMSLIAATLPLSLGSPHWPGPQMVFAMAAAWVLRRPDFAPVLLIAFVSVAGDFLMQRPPGLQAAQLILVTEFLRTRSTASREWPFVLEWAIVATMLLLMLLGNRLILVIFAVPQPRFGLEAQQFISTILAYPIVVWLSVYALGLQRLAPGSRGGYA